MSEIGFQVEVDTTREDLAYMDYGGFLILNVEASLECEDSDNGSGDRGGPVVEIGRAWVTFPDSPWCGENRIPITLTERESDQARDEVLREWRETEHHAAFVHAYYARPEEE